MRSEYFFCSSLTCGMQNTVYPPTRGTVTMNPRTTLGGLSSMTTKQLSSRICEDLVADLRLPMKDTSSWFYRPNTLGQLREYTQVQLVALTALPSPRYSCCQESHNSVASAEAATGTNDYNKVWDMDTWIVGIGVNPPQSTSAISTATVGTISSPPTSVTSGWKALYFRSAGILP